MKASNIFTNSHLLLFFIILPPVIINLTGCQSVRKILKSSDELPVVESDKPKISKKSTTTNQQQNEISSKDESGKQKQKTIEHSITENIYKKKKIADKNVSVTNNEIDIIVKTAESFLGTPYAWGGMSHKGVDCSGLVVLAFKSVNKPMARVSGEQAKGGFPIHKNQLRKGDILFFESSKKGVIGHSAIVVEVKNNRVKFIHASNTGVRYDYLDSAHWSNKFICARRYNE